MKTKLVRYPEDLAQHIESQDIARALHTLFLETLMDAERRVYAEENHDLSNGYRPRRVRYEGHILQLRTVRTRNKGFYPKLLHIIRGGGGAVAKLEAVCFLPASEYGGMQRYVSMVYKELYSRKQIARLSATLQNLMEHWRGRSLSPHYERVILETLSLPLPHRAASAGWKLVAVLGLDAWSYGELLGVYGVREGVEGDALGFVENLRARGVRAVGAVASDGQRAMEEAVLQQFPRSI